MIPTRVEVPLVQFVHLVAGRRDVRDVQAARRLRDARRPARRDRRRRDPVLHAPALARPHARSRHRPGAQQSRENPVYYVQYAHARIASMLRRLPDERVAGRAGVRRPTGATAAPPRRAPADQEAGGVPGRDRRGGRAAAPHRIAGYALELAQDFTSLLRAVQGDRRDAGGGRVVPDRAVAGGPADDRDLAGAAGVSAPESM